MTDSFLGALLICWLCALSLRLARHQKGAAASSSPWRFRCYADGWTDLVLGPDRPVRVVDGLITGWHDAGASHLLLARGSRRPDLVTTAYQEAVEHGYLWHEFGDSALLLPELRTHWWHVYEPRRRALDFSESELPSGW